MELIGFGRDADVFALGNGRVLRRYRDGGTVAAEVEVMGYVASLGYPVPAVFEAYGTDLVMERVDGPTMLAELLGRRMDPVTCGRTLARLHNQLHDIPALHSLVPFERVIHLDLHPDNVILTARGPVVIDWRNATDGVPSFDNALTAVTIAQAVLAGIVDAEFSDAARATLRAYLEAIDHPFGENLHDAIALRRNNIKMTAEETAVLDQAPAFIASVA